MANEELKAGMKAPVFSAESTDGTKIALKDFKGKNVVLYFYPKDDTPGCTKEACAFRDSNADLKKLGAVVLGVSKDDVASHEKFAAKFSLNFPLLADTTGAICEAYGVWQEKSNYGKKYMGIVRSTFLIDGKGVVRNVWRTVKVDTHAGEVLEALKEIQ